MSNQAVLQLHKAWVGFFEAMEQWRGHPDRFTGRPKLPGYKHRTEGRNLLVYEKGAIWRREIDQGVIAVSELGALLNGPEPPDHPRGTHCSKRRSLRHRGRLRARGEAGYR